MTLGELGKLQGTVQGDLGVRRPKRKLVVVEHPAVKTAPRTGTAPQAEAKALSTAPAALASDYLHLNVQQALLTLAVGVIGIQVLTVLLLAGPALFAPQASDMGAGLSTGSAAVFHLIISLLASFLSAVGLRLFSDQDQETMPASVITVGTGLFLAVGSLASILYL